MTPFQFSVTRLFNALKVKSIGDWSKETKSRNVTIGIIESLPTKTIHDIYYDTHDRRMLSKRALVRKRNDKWSAWVRLHNNSLQHQVWTSSKDVGDLVHSRSYVLSKKLNPRKPDILIWPAWQRANWGLHPLAEYTFERQHWKVHCNVGNYGEAIFDVYWDKSDFGYEGGEVEFVKSIPKKTQTNEWKKQTAENAENAIIRFMKALPHVFDIGSHNYKQWPMGILRAYMEKYPGGWGEQQGLPPVDLTDEESQESQEYEKRPFIIRRIPSGPRPEIDHFKTIPWEGTLEEWMPSITTPEVNKTNFRNMLQSEPLGESVSASRTVDARHTVRAAVEVVEEEDDEQDPFQILETEKR
ncbi:hypothetical protein QBC38DRAFT_490990 [Podospora fimiseda]|uniref:CYTH domain-containing protein n=1 Tax=Podospora fimiseda TaxID=252190 RepID=A0AAN6YMG0_9PEZI|nr:hypothetical protein QBC38DRAFT_490990 [Podospora fimiseda]